MIAIAPGNITQTEQTMCSLPGEAAKIHSIYFALLMPTVLVLSS
jgi:hypothetical protein